MSNGWIVVSSQFGVEGVDAAGQIIENGGSALDAVEEGARIIESKPEEHTVGLGGYPNLVGQVELDASIMDGTTLRFGAVGALRGYRHAITVARAVMERLPHLLVVGEGAAHLASEIGMEQEDLLTEEAAKVWRKGIDGELEEGSYEWKLMRMVKSMVSKPGISKGTVNFIARDRTEHLASAVSTSGLAWKYPGRLGDTPILGAGNYADDRHGAAACTGHGELAIRSGTARRIVTRLSEGASLEEACVTGLRDLADLGMEWSQIYMSVVAIDRDGNHLGASTWDESFYAYRTQGMTSVQTQPNLIVRL